MVYAKLWPILAIFFLANLLTIWCTLTGLNDAVVYQNMKYDYKYVVNKVYSTFPPRNTCGGIGGHSPEISAR